MDTIFLRCQEYQRKMAIFWLYKEVFLPIISLFPLNGRKNPLVCVSRFFVILTNISLDETHDLMEVVRDRFQAYDQTTAD